MYEQPYHKNEVAGASFLVTGGAGFIGSHLVEYLLRYGAATVRVLDNLSTGSLRNLEAFRNHPAFAFLEGDIRDPQTCRTAVAGIDYVLHEAALGSVPRSVIDPLTSNAVNVSGFLNMLEAVRHSPVKRMVYAASSSTYGDSPGLPKVEERIGNPLSPYAVTKYVNELYANVYSSGFGLSLTGLRYFNVFGPRQDPAGAYAAVIPRFADNLIRREPPQINGDGNHSRDFTFVENVVQANILAMFTTDAAAVNTVFNVACGERTTLNQLVEKLKEFLAVTDPGVSAIQPVFGPDRKGDIPHSLASIEKAARLLGYRPRFSFADGLQQTVSWYAKNPVTADKKNSQ